MQQVVFVDGGEVIVDGIADVDVGSAVVNVIVVIAVDVVVWVK